MSDFYIMTDVHAAPLDTLIKCLVASHGNRNPKLGNVEDTYPIYLNEFIHRLSSATSKEQENALMNQLNDLCSKKTKEEITNDITKAYQDINNKLIGSIKAIIPNIANDYQSGLNELHDHLIHEDRDLHKSLIKDIPNKDIFEKWANNEQNKGMLRNNNRNNNILLEKVQGTSLERTFKQGICLSKMLYFFEVNADTWQDLKMRSRLAIAVLSEKHNDKSTYLSSMTQEKSPVFRAFKDVINAICTALDIEPVFNPSKVQVFKSALNDIKTDLALGDLSLRESYKMPSPMPKR